jgi:hypothetical protein
MGREINARSVFFMDALHFDVLPSRNPDIVSSLGSNSQG